MARDTEACSRCRRAGVKLFLKGEKCYTDKCPVSRRAYAPGERGRRPVRQTEYSVQLREKQKTKQIYGLLEKQFKNYYLFAARQKGITGENMLRLLEMRLDNIVFRLGLAFSRKQARQLVGHGHFEINGRVVNIPSARLRPGDAISVKDKKKVTQILETEATWAPETPLWLQLASDKLSGNVLRFPTREEIETPIKEQLIVEFYSK